MKSIEKGSYGYLDAKKKKQAIMSAVGIAAIIITVIVGYIAFHNRANYFTIAAALVSLPTAKALAGLIAILKYKTPDKNNYDKLIRYNNNCIILSDLLLTSRENMMSFDFAVINNSHIVLYTNDKKMDIAKAEKYIKDFIKNDIKNSTVNTSEDGAKSDIKDISVKIVKDYSSIIKTAKTAVRNTENNKNNKNSANNENKEDNKNTEDISGKIKTSLLILQY